MNIANRITVFRVLLIPCFVAAILYYRPGNEYLRLVALGIFVVAGISDAVDGFLARRLKNSSRLGVILDPIADKCFLISSFICLAMVENLPPHLRLPPWVPLIVISRDLILIIGTAVIYLTTSEVKVKPSNLGKLTTFFQTATIVSLLGEISFHAVIRDAAIVLTILSGIGYIRAGMRYLNI